jgi:tRNA(Ile2) C34 agmatinyltransferase TiaS
MKAFCSMNNEKCSSGQLEALVRQCEPECEDCGEPTKRRTRCELCGYLICGWCRNHVHSAHIQQAVSNTRTLEKQLRASA